MIKLDGKWSLYPISNESMIDTPEQLAKFNAISADVPGNVELDLINSGMLPKDIYKGMNIKLAEKYELYDWWYETEFTTPEFNENLKIKFEGVDCFAQYWLNGNIIGESDNMLLPYEFDITDKVNKTGEKNTLYIKISSAIIQANELGYDLYNIDSHPQPNADGISVRKPPHCFGWDIMPRAVSAGIWKSVVLYEKEPLTINQIHYHILSCDEQEAKIRFLWELDIPSDFLQKEIYLNVSGKCNNSEFSFCEKIYFKLGKKEITIKNPQLWWPKGYGAANIYDTSVTVECEG